MKIRLTGLSINSTDEEIEKALEQNRNHMMWNIIILLGAITFLIGWYVNKHFNG